MNILKEMYRLVEAAEAKKIQIRAIGGLAINVHNKKNHPLFIREFGDLDFVVASKQRRDFEAFMPTVGYSPHKQFNVLNGDQRQIYYHTDNDLKIDIFVGDFFRVAPGDADYEALRDEFHDHYVTRMLLETRPLS